MITVRVVKRKARRQFVLRWTDRHGRKRERSSGTNRRRDAERAAADLELELNSPTDNGSILWHVFRERCERERYGGSRKSTRLAFQSMANKLESILNPWQLSDLTSSSISRMASTMRDQGLAEQSIATYLGTLRAVLTWASDMELIREVPKFGAVVQKARVRHMRGRPITDEEFDRMIVATESVIGELYAHRWAFYLRGLWLSGLRLDESLRLRWEEHDTDPHIVAIDKPRPLLRVWSEGEKGKRDRLLPLTPDFVEHLRSVPDIARRGFVFVLPVETPNRRQKRIKTRAPKTVSKKISAIGAAARVVIDSRGARTQHATAHDLRRSFGSRWAAKVRPGVLKELMRHRSIETTMKYYVSESAERTATEVWNAFEAQESDKAVTRRDSE